MFQDDLSLRKATAQEVEEIESMSLPMALLARRMRDRAKQTS
jgi:hypothetical protein